MRKHPKVLIGGLSIGIFLIGFLVFLAGHYAPVAARVLLAGDTAKLALNEPLTVSFSFPVNRRLLDISITPEIEGSWQWDSAIFGHMSRQATFIPETVWAPDQTYTVTLQELGPFLAERPTQTVALQAETMPLPTIVSSSIAEGARDVPTTSEIALALDQPIVESVDFSFRLEPAAAITVQEDTTNNQYVIRPEQPLAIGQSYKLIAEREIVFRPESSGTVAGRSAREKIFERFFTIKTPPNVTSFAPSGESVNPATKEIEVVFSRPMDRASVERIVRVEPAVSGQWTWLNDTALRYQLTQSLSLDTPYAVIFGEGGKDQAGDVFAPVSMGFQTAGTLRLVTATPNRQSGVGRATPLRLTFDQVPDERSVRERFSVSPATDLQFSLSGRTIVVSPTGGWALNTTYTATLQPGAVGQYGRPLKSEVVVRFTTEEKVVILPIAWDRQDRALSCEAAALKMALAGKGVRVSEDDIMARIGYDPTPRTNGGWGDPDVAFVGDINGSQNTTGYGVHWGPIARAASAWRPVKAVSGLSLSDAARELEAGNPIVIWGVMGASYYDPWVTPGGRTIAAWKGEHARTLIGFRGSVENPTSFIINDPIAGRVSWSAAKLRSNWATFSNSGVIVY